MDQNDGKKRIALLVDYDNFNQDEYFKILFAFFLKYTQDWFNNNYLSNILSLFTKIFIHLTNLNTRGVIHFERCLHIVQFYIIYLIIDNTVNKKNRWFCYLCKLV